MANGLVDINIYNLLYPGNPLNFFTLISKLEIGTMTGDYYFFIIMKIGQRKLIILVHYKYTLMNDNTERNTNQFE